MENRPDPVDLDRFEKGMWTWWTSRFKRASVIRADPRRGPRYYWRPPYRGWVVQELHAKNPRAARLFMEKDVGHLALPRPNPGGKSAEIVIKRPVWVTLWRRRSEDKRLTDSHGKGFIAIRLSLPVCGLHTWGKDLLFIIHSAPQVSLKRSPSAERRHPCDGIG